MVSLFFLIYARWKSGGLGRLFEELIASVLANLIFVFFGFCFREEIFNFFQRPGVSLASSCQRRTDNVRKYLYDCNIILKNTGEMPLRDFRVVVSSSKTFSNFNFSSCAPNDLKATDGPTVTSETADEGTDLCKYRLSLGSFEKVEFKLVINGDQNEPDPEVLH